MVAGSGHGLGDHAQWAVAPRRGVLVPQGPQAAGQVGAVAEVPGN
jgi:hypothetical protein